MSAATVSVECRFWSKVDKYGPIPEHCPEIGPCWVWTASLFNRGGYGAFGRSTGSVVRAHRFAWEMANGAPPRRIDVEVGAVMRTFAMEHKSTSEDVGAGSMFWKRLRLDTQSSNYFDALRDLGYEPDGLLFDLLRKPGLRPLEVNSKRSAPESPEAYRDRCVADIAADPDKYYQRGIVVRLEDEERDAAHDAWQTAEQIRYSRNAERWPRNPDSCIQYGRPCDYWEVCAGERDIRDSMFFEAGPIHPELETKHHLPMLTTSSARAYRACPRRYMFSYELGIRPKRVSGARAFGHVMHAALEAWLRGGYDLDAAIAVTLGRPLDFETAKLQAMLTGYHARWADEPLEVLAVEQEYTAPLINPETGASSRTFIRAGKLDAIVRKAA